MKGDVPHQEAYNISSDDSDSDSGGPQVTKKDYPSLLRKQNLSDEEILLRRAKMYQEYMRHMTIPTQRESVIPCNSWQGLARSMKKLYGQPLHYLTNVLVRQWDLQREGSVNENAPLDDVIHPWKAEARIWLTEEVHRLTSSHYYLAKMWASDCMYHANIDSVASVAPQDVMLID